ncbi:MAG: GIY-YIG nuclease family protein, partial [Bacteroidales bacterium]
FYIIYSKSVDKYYLGHSQDLVDRLRKHNSNHKGFTGKANDWEVVYSESYSNKSDAYARELQIKKWKNRKRIKRLISKKQP